MYINNPCFFISWLFLTRLKCSYPSCMCLKCFVDRKTEKNVVAFSCNLRFLSFIVNVNYWIDPGAFCFDLENKP